MSSAALDGPDWMMDVIQSCPSAVVLTRDEVRELALIRLSSMARSRHDVQAYLVRKGADPEDAAAILDRFEEVGILNDAEYAGMVARTAVTMRGLSTPAVRRLLRTKGIDPIIIDQTVTGVSRDDELATATQFVRKSLRSSDRLPTDKRRTRAISGLARRGFSMDIALAAWQQVLDEDGPLD